MLKVHYFVFDDTIGEFEKPYKAPETKETFVYEDEVDANEKATVEADIQALKDVLAKSTPETMTDADVEEIKAGKEKDEKYEKRVIFMRFCAVLGGFCCFLRDFLSLHFSCKPLVFAWKGEFYG